MPGRYCLRSGLASRCWRLRSGSLLPNGGLTLPRCPGAERTHPFGTLSKACSRHLQNPLSDQLRFPGLVLVTDPLHRIVASRLCQELVEDAQTHRSGIGRALGVEHGLVGHGTGKDCQPMPLEAPVTTVTVSRTSRAIALLERSQAFQKSKAN